MSCAVCVEGACELLVVGLAEGGWFLSSASARVLGLSEGKGEGAGSVGEVE